MITTVYANNTVDWSTSNKIDVLCAEIQEIKLENDNLKKENETLKMQNTEFAKRMEIMEKEIWKHKIIVQGIKEMENESDVIIKENIRKILREINMKNGTREVRRIGIKLQNRATPRPILIECIRKKKLEVLKSVKEVIYGYRKITVSKYRNKGNNMKEARAKGHKAILRSNKLIIDDESYTIKQLKERNMEARDLDINDIAINTSVKIVIKGDRNVGKTCLFHRLQGKKFLEEYIPTEEIQVASIHWNYKATDDVVKVEVWDVVDRGKKKKRFDGLKLENSQIEMPAEPALDAEFLDVYKGTNGVIMMMDLTKTWTFEYVQREITKVPSHIPIIILANHCDMSHHRTVTSDHVVYFIESIVSNRVAQVRYAESSMRNGFGLKLLHKFFNLPFLQLQKETLLRQLERNEEETRATIQELDMYFESDEANYNKFLDSLIKRRREVADLNANIPPQVPVSQSLTPPSIPQDTIKRSQSGPIIIGGGKPIPYNPLTGTSYKKVNDAPSIPKSSSQGSGFASKLIGKDRIDIKDDSLPDLRRLELNSITSVEEFCPDGGQLDRTFLEDVQSSPHSNPNEVVDSDSDEDTGNPLVSEFQDDFEPEEGAFLKSNPYAKSNLSESRYNAISKRPAEVGNEDVDKTLPEDYDMKQTNDEFDSTINSEISEITSEAFDTWMGADSKWRRSPEGGEDVSAVSHTLDYSGSAAYDDSTSVTSSNVHMELLSSKYSHTSANVSVNSDCESAPPSLNSIKKEKKEKEKPEKKHKTKKSKDKASKTDKKNKKRSRDESASHRDELEEFLCGSVSPTADSAYEAI
ncbi:hypothetical protein FQA39_LY15775 [Lamprigera yunnana]|nr:hypothetical protein FQA39_LY15775 [Lamprigera yunnana]